MPSKHLPRYGVYDLLLASLSDSRVPETRFHWRMKLGLSDEQINDPRPLSEIVSPGQVPDWLLSLQKDLFTGAGKGLY